MPRVDRLILEGVEESLQKYEKEVECSMLARSSKDTYLLHARNFVRWLKDDFEPGANVRYKK